MNVPIFKEKPCHHGTVQRGTRPRLLKCGMATPYRAAEPDRESGRMGGYGDDWVLLSTSLL